MYEQIISYEKKGTFVYEKYEDLPNWRHDIIRGHVMRWIKNSDVLINPEHPDYYFFQEKYPQYWKEAQVLYEHGLL